MSRDAISSNPSSSTGAGDGVRAPSSKKRSIDQSNENPRLILDPYLKIPSRIVPIAPIDDMWVSPTSLRNFLLRDPFQDYWNLYGSTKNGEIFSKFGEERSPFVEFLLEQGIKFEKGIIGILLDRFRDKVHICEYESKSSKDPDLANQTLDLMRKGIPIIVGGILHNPNMRVYGIPDLIVRSDYLNKLVGSEVLTPSEVKIGAPRLGLTRFHYRIVDIKYNILHLKANGRTLLNSGSVPAFKGQVILYTLSLGYIQGYIPNRGYLLGRGYSYISKGNDFSGTSAFDRLGEIDLIGDDKEYLQKISEGLIWIRDLRRDGSTWKLLPAPSRPELYPNLKNRSGSMEVKSYLASQIREITQIWYCGIKHRESAAQSGVYRWDDPRCTTEILGHRGSKIGPTVDKILKFQREALLDPEILFTPSVIEKHRNEIEIIRSNKLEIYLDLEFISRIFDPLTSLPTMGGGNYIFLIGMGYSIDNKGFEFQPFMSKPGFGLEEEEGRILTEFIREIKSLIGKYPNFVVYHWSQADPLVLEKAMDRHPSLTKVILNYLDLHRIFRDEPILINGVYNFSLKSVIKGLSEKNLIDFSYSNEDNEGIEGQEDTESCDDGCTAMYQAWRAYNSEVEDGDNILNSILKYNRKDCRALAEIVEFIRRNLINKSLGELVTQVPNNSEMSRNNPRYSLRSRVPTRHRCLRCGAPALPDSALCGGSSCQNEDLVIEEENREEVQEESMKRQKSSSDESSSASLKKKKRKKIILDQSSSDSSESLSEEIEAEVDPLAYEADEEAEDEEAEDEEAEDEEAEDEEGEEEEEREFDPSNEEAIRESLRELASAEKLNNEESNQLTEIGLEVAKKTVTARRILQSPLSKSVKSDLLELYLILCRMNPMSAKYKELQDEINSRLLATPEVLRSSVNEIVSVMSQKEVTLETILELPASIEKRTSLVEKYQQLLQYNPISEEYFKLRSLLTKEINSIKKGEKDYRERLAESNLSVKAKSEILAQIKLLEELDPRSDGSEYIKKKGWLDFVLRLPTKRQGLQCIITQPDGLSSTISLGPQTPPEILSLFRKQLREELDKSCYGMEEAKLAMIDYVFTVIANPESKQHILGIVGSKGVAKTTLAMALARVLEKPIIKIPLGGMTDSTKLKGHSLTYIGSMPGDVSRGLVDAQYTDPVIYLDEIDKVCSRNGELSEVNGVLTHMLDANHNPDYILDDYVGFPVDLSAPFYIVTFNREDMIDGILKDRIPIIRVKGYSPSEKVIIAQKYMTADIEKNLKLETGSYSFSDDTIYTLIGMVEEEEGVRKLRESMEMIIKRLNGYRMSQEPFILNNKTKVIITLPFEITPEIAKSIIKPIDRVLLPMYN